MLQTKENNMWTGCVRVLGRAPSVSLHGRPLDAISEDEDGAMFEDMPGTWEDAELEPVLSWLHATVACNR